MIFLLFKSAIDQWDRKTIALGTFPDEEASIMCKRAKVLTKTWRSMHPKPSVEEVKRCLERSGIRVVNERPGRQSKKERAKGEGISAGIQESSLLSFVANPPRPIATVTINTHTDSVANVAEGGIPSESKVQADPFLRKLSEPVSNLITTPLRSNHQILPIGPQQSIAKFIDIQEQEQEQVIGRFAHPDLEIHNDETYRLLEKHYSTIKTELEEIQMMMNICRDERDRRQLLRETHRKPKSESQIDQQFGIQLDPITISQAPNPHMKVYHDFQNNQTEKIKQEEMIELYAPMDDDEDNDSITMMIKLEGW